MRETQKFIFISGGTRGIGRAVALSQARAGCTLFLNYMRDEESAKKTKRDTEKKGARVILLRGNVGDAEMVVTLFASVKNHTDRLDALVHCAALGVFKPVHRLRVKDWDVSLDVNAKALVLLAQAALPLMQENGGNIVAISSLGSHRVTPNYGAIGISKAAVENTVRYLAAELAGFNIHVNAVSGGLVDTDSLKMFPKIDRMKKEYILRTPAGRIGRPEDIADVVSFLLSDQSGWIYGQTLVADGGYSLL